MHFKLSISAKNVHSEHKIIAEDAPTIRTVHKFVPFILKKARSDAEGQLQRPLMKIYLVFRHLSILYLSSNLS